MAAKDLGGVTGIFSRRAGHFLDPEQERIDTTIVSGVALFLAGYRAEAGALGRRRPAKPRRRG